MSMDKPFRVEVTVDAPRDVVWRELTEPEQIRHWFGWEYDGLEDEIQLIFVEHATLRPPDRIELSADGLIELEDLGEPHPDPRHQARRPLRRRMAGRLRRHRGGLDHVLPPAPPPPRPPPGLEPPHDRAAGPVALPALPGEPWHESRYQRGADVDGALVIVFAKPERRSHAARHHLRPRRRRLHRRRGSAGPPGGSPPAIECPLPWGA